MLPQQTLADKALATLWTCMGSHPSVLSLMDPVGGGVGEDGLAHGAGHGQIRQAEVVDVGPGWGPAGTTRYGLS